MNSHPDIRKEYIALKNMASYHAEWVAMYWDPNCQADQIEHRLMSQINAQQKAVTNKLKRLHHLLEKKAKRSLSLLETIAEEEDVTSPKREPSTSTEILHGSPAKSSKENGTSPSLLEAILNNRLDEL